MIGDLRKPIKYEIRNGGPDAVGALFVEGQKFNVQTLYNVPSLPATPGVDSNGLPVLFNFDLDSMNLRNLQKNLQDSMNPRSSRSHESPDQALMDIASYQHMVELRTQMLLSARHKRRLNARMRLANDIAAIEANNKLTDESNDRVSALLRDLIHVNKGKDPESWKTWWADQQGYVYEPEKPRPKPTFVAQVNPAQLVASAGWSSAPVVHTACFAAGTPVRTKLGPRTIETLKVGDVVLSQDPATGSLSYQPILVVHHNPPAPLLRLKLSKDEIEVTGIHRFWVAARGWVMARDLKAGDEVRVVGGVSRVESVKPTGKVEPVFNLNISSNHDFFVGRSAALAHDNSLIQPRDRRFDATSDMARAR